MGKHQFVNLSEVCNFVSEKISVHSLTKKSYISTENMLPNKCGTIEASTLPNVMNVTKYSIEDVLISNIRPYFKKIWKASHIGGASNDVLVLRNKPNYLSGFLYYVLAADDFFTYATKTSKGTKMPRGDKVAIMQYQAPLIDLDMQKKIAGVLSRYDTLIENNNRRIAILEDMAQRLYREWFVHFRFPGHENVEMVNSELGMIPEGWEVAQIADCCSVIRRGISPRYSDEAEGIVINQKCVRDFTVNLELARYQNKAYPPELQIQLCDVLINSTGVGTLGRIAQIYEFVPNCTIDSHVTLARPCDNIQHLVGGYFREMQETIMDMGTGSTGQTELNRDKLKEMKTLIPDENTVGSFETYVSSWMQLKNQLQKKNIKLRQTRDLLLPRLISGDIDVSNIDIPV